ncbi:MAG: CYTH domain-containing protein, partial [Patescibacteria group bacterium]
MKIEYEATFTEVDVEWVRGRLKTVGAALVKPNFLQKRVVFNFPKGNEVKGGWARVRDEGDKVTMSVKIVDGDKITDQKEAQIVVDDFDGAVSLLTMVGCIPKAYQETRRELWTLDGVEITIDEWPFLPPFVEIEGASEEVVKAA